MIKKKSLVKVRENSSMFQQGISLIEVMVALVILSLISLTTGIVLLQNQRLNRNIQEMFERTLMEWSTFDKKQLERASQKNFSSRVFFK